MKFNQYIKKNVEDAREKYRDAGYQNVRCIGAIITRISPDDFYACQAILKMS